jgi:hypothetical protein
MNTVQISMEWIIGAGFALMSTLLGMIWTELRTMSKTITIVTINQADHAARISHIEKQCARCLEDK